jgi:urease accessory protein
LPDTDVLPPESARPTADILLADEYGAGIPQAANSRWSAELELGFAARGERTVLARRRHQGPLRVQKALYPEGPSVCQAVVLHPPGGIVGGDHLELQVDVAAGAHALITTPGATKWYRSSGPAARQIIDIRVGASATMEWLPQETIVYDGALAAQHTAVELSAGARYIGWEVSCLGRTASGERFDAGRWSQRLALSVGGHPLFLEYGQIEGGSTLLTSPAGLAGRAVSGLMLIAADDIDDALLAALRIQAPAANDFAGITPLRGPTGFPVVIAARYLGGTAQAARKYFERLWALARPAVLDRAAHRPRIWNC